jgi:hypothetical protein
MNNEEFYKEKFHEEYNQLLKLDWIGTDDIYSFCETFFILKELERREKL